jgi:hypothetical protein
MANWNCNRLTARYHQGGQPWHRRGAAIDVTNLGTTDRGGRVSGAGWLALLNLKTGAGEVSAFTDL